MGNIAAADIVYTSKDVYSGKIVAPTVRRRNLISVAMGNATNKTQATTGIPLAKGGLGMTTFLEFVIVVDTTGSETALWTFDLAHQSLVAFTAEGTKATTFTNDTQTVVVEAVGY
jgi:hypothetical protein